MEDETWPPVSVVIPARGAEATLATAMRSALGQEYPGTLELVVAAAGFDDGTWSEAHEVAVSDPRVRIVTNPRGITPAGLNLAIKESVGEVIVRCDAQSTLPPGYVATSVALLTETGADVVGGVQAARGSTFFERAVAIAMTTRLGTGGALFRVGGPPGPTDTVYLGVFRRSAFERVGLFDESMLRNQDYELNHRIRASGGTVYFHPSLAVSYRPRPSLRALWRQYHQYGHWKRCMLRRHPESVRLRQLVPPLFVLGLVASAVLAFTRWRSAAIGVPGAYGAALVGTSVYELLRRRDLAAIITPVTLAAMHLAWGVGFITSDGDNPQPAVPRLPSS